MSALAHRRSTRSERGSALTLAIVIMVLGMIVIAAIFTMLDWSGERGKSRTDRAANVAVIDRAIASYEYALESNLTNEYHRFRLDQPAMQRLAQGEGSNSAVGVGTVVSNTTFGADFKRYGLDRTWMNLQGDRVSYEWSMKHDLGDGRTSWWQLVNSIPPGQGSASLVAYVRTWIAAGDQNSKVITEPRVARVELRPGRFSDYQLLVDGPLIISNGTTIQGRVHTNGYPDAYLMDAFARPSQPLVLGSGAGPTCVRGAAFSTARGQIVGNCRGFNAPRDEANGRLIDLLRGQAHLELLRSMCGPVVFCPGGAGPWQIDLSANQVNGANIPAQAQAVYVRGEAFIRGTTTRRITIGVASRPGSYGAFGSASLSLMGNGPIGAANPSVANGGTVGLVVEGDVVPRIDLGQCPNALNAAVVSTSGALTIPAQYRVPVQPAGSTPTCASYRVVGSLGTHYAPLMYLAWGVTAAGYLQADFQYDARLRSSPPPLFPLTGPWQVTSWKDAMSECLSESNRARPDCG
jgi:hypothetical protein